MKKLFACLVIAFCVFCFSAATPLPAQAAGTYAATIDGVDYTLMFVLAPFGPYEVGDAYLYDTFGNLVAEYSYTAVKSEDDSVMYDLTGMGLCVDKGGMLKVYPYGGVTFTRTNF